MAQKDKCNCSFCEDGVLLERMNDDLVQAKQLLKTFMRITSLRPIGMTSLDEARRQTHKFLRKK